VHAAGARIHHLRQLVGVGRLELRERAVLEQHLGQRMVRRELLQHLLVGGGLPGRGLPRDRELHALEQDLAELLGRAQVERAAGELVGLLLEREHALAERPALAAQQIRVDQHAVALHPEQDLAHRHLELAVDARELRVGRDLRVERVVQAQRDVGILGRVLGRAVDVDLVEADLARALAAHLVVGIVFQSRCRHARLSMSCGRCASSTYDCSSVSCATPATTIPWFMSACWSYFAFCPTFARAGSANHALSSAKTRSRSSWSGAPA
jgi:hypothetical protein